MLLRIFKGAVTIHMLSLNKRYDRDQSICSMPLLPLTIYLHYVKHWNTNLLRLSYQLQRQGYGRERFKPFYGRYGDLIKHYKVFFSQKLGDIQGNNHIQWHSTLIIRFTKLWHCYLNSLFTDFDIITKFRWIFIEHFQRVRLAKRGR